MSHPYGSVAFKKAPKGQQPENARRGLRVVRGNDAVHVVGEWQLAHTDTTAVLNETRKEARALQVSNPFMREKKDEPPQPPSEYFIC